MAGNGDEAMAVTPANIQGRSSREHSYTDWKVSEVIEWCSSTLNISNEDPLCKRLRDDEITGDILADLSLEDCKVLCEGDLQKAVKLKLSLNELIDRDRDTNSNSNTTTSYNGQSQEETVTVTVTFLKNLYSALSRRLRVYELQYAQLKDDVMETIRTQNAPIHGRSSSAADIDLISSTSNSRKTSAPTSRTSSPSTGASQKFEHPEATSNLQQRAQLQSALQQQQQQQQQQQHSASGNNKLNNQQLRMSASSVSLGRPPSRGRPRPPSNGNSGFGGFGYPTRINGAPPSLRAFSALSNYGPPPLPPRTGSLLSRGNEPLKQLRASKDDSCEKILKNAMRRHNLTDQDWRQYVLVISYGDKERTLELTDKPVVIFKSLKQQGLHPTIMLRRKGDFEETRDYMNDGDSGGEVSGFPDASTITPGGRL